MYEIKLPVAASTEIVYLSEDFNRNESDYSIIAYETESSTGMAILKFTAGIYGFWYHSDVLLNYLPAKNAKFKARSRSECIRLALNADRKVLAFIYASEFIKHAGEHSKL